MSDLSSTVALADVMRDIRAASANLSKAETEHTRSLSDLKAHAANLEGKYDTLESSVNELWKKTNRPGASGDGGYDSAERKDARELCILKHDLDVPKNDGNRPTYEPSSSEIDNAMLHRKALRSLFRHGNLNNLDALEKKALSSFAFGTNSFILPPAISDRVLDCLVDLGDVTGLVDNVTISAPSIKFIIDNGRIDEAGWACEASCFANNPNPDLTEGLGELEIKVESLRYVACAGTDLLQDAAFNIEQWLFRKVAEGFRRTINRAIMIGDGLGKPQGFLNPNAGIPICDVAPATAP